MEKTAACQGIHGKAIAFDATFPFANDVGARNTNKPADLKVEHSNGKWKKRIESLKGNYNERSIALMSR